MRIWDSLYTRRLDWRKQTAPTLLGEAYKGKCQGEAVQQVPLQLCLWSHIMTYSIMDRASLHCLNSMEWNSNHLYFGFARHVMSLNWEVMLSNIFVWIIFLGRKTHFHTPERQYFFSCMSGNSFLGNGLGCI